MNNKIKLAVAGAILSAATAGNAGIIIPAGDWTLDIGGNVNAFANFSDTDRNTNTIVGGTAGATATGADEDDVSVTTGLLPNYLSVSGSTRQNDVDVAFTISIQPGAATSGALQQNGVTNQENRQAFMTFGDKSWGTFKLGKDLGVFGSNAILNDMTLLGVGGAHVNRSNTTTIGGIGTGYIYADWRAQIAYTTPNMNGFQATVALMQPWDVASGAASSTTGGSAGNVGFVRNSHNNPGWEAQASYSWTGDVAGKVWVETMYEDIEDITISGQTLSNTNSDNYSADAWGIGASLTSGNLGLVAYYYDADGVGTTGKFVNGLFNSGTASAPNIKGRDSDGGYIQATYVIPTGTKLGVSYGVSNLDTASGEAKNIALVDKNERWTVGAYHPLTKHLNLVAEYTDMESETHATAEKDHESQVLSLGAILFF
jgi:predicted porin